VGDNRRKEHYRGIITQREAEVLQMIADGRRETLQEAAKELFVSVKTVKKKPPGIRIRQIRRSHDRTQAVLRAAHRKGLIKLDGGRRFASKGAWI